MIPRFSACAKSVSTARTLGAKIAGKGGDIEINMAVGNGVVKFLGVLTDVATRLLRVFPGVVEAGANGGFN